MAPAPQAAPTLTPTPAIRGKFAPPPGKTLFILGQDNDTIDAYLDAFPEPQPGGLTSYTSLQRLEGLETKTDYGAGTVHLTQLANDHPHSVIALGLYLVGYLPAITSGQADAKIDKLLDVLEGLDRPVFLRFGYEFDGAWNRYDPADYVSAWKYFHAQIQAKGSRNVVLVWQSAAYCGGTFGGQPMEAWYPGDDYVDWIGLSYFTPGDCEYRPLNELLEFARAHAKPVMIAESAPQRYSTSTLTYSTDGKSFTACRPEQIWDEWYTPYFNFIHKNADVIRAVAYINTHWDAQPMWGSPYSNGYWGDSRVQANATLRQRWLTELDREIWIFGGESLFADLNDAP